MKRLSLVALIVLSFATAQAQTTWKELTSEQKLMKAKDFRADNQKFMKEKLGMNQEQLDDIDNVNICYLSTLDRIDRYGKTDEGKEKYAKAATAARSAQLEAIMGPDKRKQFQDYVKEKLKKAGVVQ